MGNDELDKGGEDSIATAVRKLDSKAPPILRRFLFWFKTHADSIRGWTQLSVSIASIIVAFFAVRLSIRSAESGRAFSNDVISHLKDMNGLFAQATDQLDQLSQSMTDLDSAFGKFGETIQGQQSQLSSTLVILREQISEFSISLEQYEVLLSKVSSSSEKQLALIRETQANWERELRRRPVLRLVIDSATIVSDTVLTIWPKLINTGNRSAEECVVAIHCPLDLDVQSKGWRRTSVQGKFQVINLKYGTMYYSEDPGYFAESQLQDSELSINRTRLSGINVLKFTYSIFHKDGGAIFDTLFVPIPF